MALGFRVIRAVGGAALALIMLLPGLAAAREPLRIAVIDMLSGPFALEGDAMVRHLRHMAEEFNKRGGALGRELEIIPFDNKGSPQESLVILRQVADRGIQYIAQGNGSHVAGALVEALEKHNQRNPDKPILFLNYSAINPELTNEQCSFWHFRFDANTAMRLNVITDYMVGQSKIRKVFLINQDYAHGQQVSSLTKEMLARKAPGIEIVGDVLHPIGKVKDFAPYIARIRAAGADTVVTGNWGNDLSLLVKAGAEAGLNVGYYTFYAGGFGVPTAIGEAGGDQVYQVTEWHRDLPMEENKPELAQLADVFTRQNGERIPWYFHRTSTLMGMLVRAVEQAGTAEPRKVAEALEGLSYPTALGVARMRAEDHQLLQPLYISRFSKAARYEAEHSGLGWVTVERVPAEQTALPTSCQMKRPE
ncbi:MAG TPA: branched-chain amino acid ABC transporter substrate-binding protein [Gammaproteobacteria bacterium]|nr:branched-chain amino acid ABC transporter substrate-binding protein [Gammaproteobacteria bacterium]